MKKLFTFLTFLLLTSLAHGQGNVFKLNLSRFLTGKAEISYEKTFLRQFSFQMGTAVQIPFNSVPGLGNSTKTALDTLGISDLSYTGYWITPEVRFYLNPVKGAPKGFYLSAFGRVNNRIFNLKYRREVEGGTDFNDVEARMSIKGFGGGLMIGHQWIIAKHFSIDIYMFGLGINKHDATLKIADDRYSEDDYKQAVDEINGEKKERGTLFSKPVAVADGKSMSVTASSVLPIIRSLGFNIGFAF